MRRRSSVILAAALLAVGVLPPSPSAAAEPLCKTISNTQTVCVTSFALAPSTVASATGGTVTVTVGVTSTAPPPPSDVQATFRSPRADVPPPRIDLQPVAGSPGTHRGELTVPPASRVGPLALSGLDIRVDEYTVLHVWNGELAAAGFPTTVTVTGTPDTTPPVLQSMSVLGSPTADTTMGAAGVELKMRVTDAGPAGVERVGVTGGYERPADVNPNSGLSGGSEVAGLRLVSGTRADGVWRGTITLPAGTRGPWRLRVDLTDQWNNVRRLTTADLAAAGFPSVVYSQTTRAPAAPATLTGRTAYAFPIYPNPPISIAGVVEWTYAPGTPAVSGVQIDSADPACGHTPRKVLESRAIGFSDRIILLPCTVRLRLVNGAGISPPAAVTFW